MDSPFPPLDFVLSHPHHWQNGYCFQLRPQPPKLYTREMSLPGFLRFVLGGLILAGLVTGRAAAQLDPPRFQLVAPNCTSGLNPPYCYTSNPGVTVNVIYPTGQFPGLEFCITQTRGACTTDPNWIPKSQLSPFTLTGGNGLTTVYMRWRYKPYATNNSTAGSQKIFLDQSPLSISLNSPGGLPNAAPPNQGAQQMLSSDVQYITASIPPADVVPGDALTVSLFACNPTCSQTAFDTIPSVTPPYTWGTAVPGGTTYINATIANQAGTTYSTSYAPGFSVFTPGTIPQLVCSPTTPDQCPLLTVNNDSFSPSVQVYNTQTQQIITDTFQGYADPSMRRDPNLNAPFSNPYGTNLWMLYSYPEIQTGQCPPTGCTTATVADAVEIHLASSTDGGFTWNGCTPSPCSTATPIWPSLWLSMAQPAVYSSHEVSNFWPDSTGNWYGVHLMYFVQPGEPISSAISSGCLVATYAAASTGPIGLGQGWSSPGTVPVSCPTTGTEAGPSGATYTNTLISYLQLTQLAQTGTNNPNLQCQTWGEPAIMVNNGQVYLASSCFGPSFVNNGYYIFMTDSSAFPSGWTYFGGPFNIGNLPDASSYPEATFLTELDWAARPDNAAYPFVAVVTPAVIAHYPEVPATGEKQFGCVAVDFSLVAGQSSPFGSVAIQTVTDQYPLGGSKIPPTENNYGPNACTYEPTSNTGMLIVRKVTSGQYNQVYSLVETGILP